MFSERFYDVVVVGGGPIGWATAYEIAKAGSSVMVLEQNNFFNQAGSSGDMARMFRTMYVVKSASFCISVIYVHLGTRKTSWRTWHTRQ